MKVRLLPLVLLVSCSTVKDIKGPDGTPHKLFRCSVIDTCYEEASEVCGKYKIVNTSSHEESVVNGNGGGTYSKLLVKCER